MLSKPRAAIKRLLLRGLAHRAIRQTINAGGEVQGLGPEYWDLQVDVAGRLCVEGIPCMQLAKDYGTPLHVINHARLARNYNDFLGAFKRQYPRVEIGYSYKTNPLPGVLLALHELGASAEVISHFELWLALRLGVSPDRIIFNGPGKTKDALDLAVANGVKLINIDSLGEIELLASSAAHYDRIQPVGVRVVTSVGWSSQFGLALHSGSAMEAFERLVAIEGLNPCGIHVHLGTGIRNTRIYLRAVEEALDFAVELHRHFGIVLEYLDLGGGFGVPTVKEYSELDMKLRANDMPVLPLNPKECPAVSEYAAPITKLVEDCYVMRTGLCGPSLIFEPGRAISSSAQFLLLKVLASKAGENGVEYLILNGGKNITMPTGYEYHEILSVDKFHEQDHQDYNIYGPLCHPGDVLYRRKQMPRLVPGDWVAVMDSGAYFIPNQMNFSNPRPGAVMVRNGKVEFLRSPECFEDVVAKDMLPPESSGVHS